MIVMQKPEAAAPEPDALLEAAHTLLAAAGADAENHTPQSLGALVSHLARGAALSGPAALNEGGQHGWSGKVYFNEKAASETIQKFKERIDYIKATGAKPAGGGGADAISAHVTALQHDIVAEIEHEIFMLGRALKSFNSWAGAVPAALLALTYLGLGALATTSIPLIALTFLGGWAAALFTSKKLEKTDSEGVKEAVKTIRDNHISANPEAEKIKAHIEELKGLLHQVQELQKR
jgi:hypothetical protein